MTDTLEPATTGETVPNGTTSATGAPIIVGANSVYNSVEALIEGKRQADAYIAQQAALIKQLQEDLSRASNREAFQEQLKARLDDKTFEVNPENTSTAVVTEDKLKELLKTTLEQNRREEALKTRLEKARSMFGEEVDSKLEAKASELGLTKDALLNMPDAAYSALIGEPKHSDTSLLEGRIIPVLGNEEPSKSFAKRILDPKISPKELGSLIEAAIKDPSLLKDI